MHGTSSSDSSFFDVIRSYLPEYLFVRLITYATDVGDLALAGIVIAPTSGALWAPKLLQDYVTPKPFTLANSAAWTLLSNEEEAYALWSDWSSDPRYNAKEDNKPNYFRNAVDAFKHNMEERWSQQVK